MTMGENSYHEVFKRIAAALEGQGGFREALKGQRFDFRTDDGVRACVAALARSLGAEVANA